MRNSSLRRRGYKREGTEETFEEVIAEKFPNLMINIDLYRRSMNAKYDKLKGSILRQIIIELSKAEDKKGGVLKASKK